MKLSILLTFPILATALATQAPAADGWLTDYGAASAEAEEHSKDLLIEFTGSDWCPPCIKLAETVTTQASFVKSASEDFALLSLDFPKKTEQNPDLRKANRALATRYAIRGYPTVLLCDAEGLPYAKTGLRSGLDPAGYLEHLAELRQNKAARDHAFAKAKELDGTEKAAALHLGLTALQPEVVNAYYADIIAEIRDLDPTREIAFEEPPSPQEQMATALQGAGGDFAMLGRMMELMGKPGKENSRQIVKELDAHLAENQPRAEIFQALLLIRGQARGKLGDSEGILNDFRAAIEAAPDSSAAMGLKDQLSALEAKLGDEPAEDE